MKMLSHASLALLSVVTICVCGPQHTTHVASMAPASEVFSKAAPWDFSLSDEEIAAAGLGGLDGAVVFSVDEEHAMSAASPSRTMLTSRDGQHRRPGS